MTNDKLRGPVLLAATVATGLIAGMFFAFSFSVMPGFARLDDRTFVVAMRHNIDATVESATFMTTFTAALLLLVAAVVVHHRLGLRTAMWWTLAALVCYLIAFGITMAVHLPLNEALGAAGTPGEEEAAALRSDFEGPWNRAHSLRTLTGTLALACLSLAGTARGRAGGSPGYRS